MRPFTSQAKAYCSSVLFPIGDMANFSDRPSCMSTAKPRWSFYALRDLEEGDEITFDYVPGCPPSEVPHLFGFAEETE